MKKIPYTKEGYDDLLKEKTKLDAQRVDAVKEVAVASALGDRSENAAYKYGKQKLHSIDRQLRFVNNQLRWAVIVEPRADGTVGIGSKVVVNDGSGEREFTIVGGYESNLSKGWISQYAPLGKALMGKKLNDTVHFNAPHGLKKSFSLSGI
jgi:transcription elongation GreA/GreB family factor